MNAEVGMRKWEVGSGNSSIADCRFWIADWKGKGQIKEVGSGNAEVGSRKSEVGMRKWERIGIAQRQKTEGWGRGQKTEFGSRRK